MSSSLPFGGMIQPPQQAAQQAQQAQPNGPYDVVVVLAQSEAGSRAFEFPRHVCERYPALLTPEARFLRLDVVYDVLVFSDITMVSDQLLRDSDDRRRFLLVTSKLGYELSPTEMAHLCRRTGMSATIRAVKQHAKSLGARLNNLFGARRVNDWLALHDEQQRVLNPTATSQGLTGERLLRLVMMKGKAGHEALFAQNRIGGAVETFLGNFCQAFGIGQGFRP